MALSIVKSVLIPWGTDIAPGGTEAAPVTAGNGSTVAGPFADALDVYHYQIANGASAPGAPLTLVFESSPDGDQWTEVARVSGDTVANSKYSGKVPDAGSTHFRARAFGNTTNSVKAGVTLSRQVP